VTQDKVDKRSDGSYYAGTRPELLPFCPRACKRVLDVGCGIGRFGRSIKDVYQAEVWGVEICEDVIPTAMQNLDKAFCADIARDHQLLPDDYFDTIFFNDVLEHLVDPQAMLEIISAKLTQGGTVVASIPNIRCHKVLYEILIKRDFRYVSAGVLDRTHLRFFTRKSSVRMFESAGYDIQDVTPINKSKSMKPVFYKLMTLGLIGSDISYPQFVVRATKP